MTKTKTIEISELIQKANDLNCSLSLNFSIGENTESGSFVADFLPIADKWHPIKSTWGYWSEAHQFSGGTTIRLFKPAEEEKEFELEIDGLTFPDKPINPLTGCNGISESDFLEDFFYTADLSENDQKSLDLIVAEIENQHGVDGRKSANEMIEHEKKNDHFEAYDRAKGLEE